MHVHGGHPEQRRQRTQRDARNGAAAAVVVSRCSRSLTASVACQPPPRGNAAVQHLSACRQRRQTREEIGGNVGVCKKAGGKRPGKGKIVRRGKCLSPQCTTCNKIMCFERSPKCDSPVRKKILEPIGLKFKQLKSTSNGENTILMLSWSISNKFGAIHS